MIRLKRLLRTSRGFTLVELGVALVVFAIVAVALLGVMVRTNQGERMGSTMAEAQQNARAALDVILRDLREAGYGVNRLNQVPIERASEYRLTFVIDRNTNGVVDPGERITYFVDNNTADPVVARTPNPIDVILRRVISTAGDPQATPATGAGQIVAYGITQRTGTATTRNTPLFDFLDANGVSLLASGLTDPDGAQFGATASDSALGVPAGTLSSEIFAVRVDIVAEGSHRDPETHTFRQVRVSGTIYPRNLHPAGERLLGSLIQGTGTGSGTGTGTGTGTGVGTGTAPPDTGEVPPELPPQEPPIRIPTERVLSLSLTDMNEHDSREGSRVTLDYQHDLDILVGTQANGTNNLAVWFEGYPDLYSTGTLYNAYPSYTGYTAKDINAVATGELDGKTEHTDVVSAVSISDVAGGFEVWLNQGEVGRAGVVGIGDGVTVSNGYFSENSGRGQAIALADVDYDGDQDVLLGTRTGANNGNVEVWLNSGVGSFIHDRDYSMSGEVNMLAVADFNGDGWPDFAAGSKTTSSSNNGNLEVWINKTGDGFGRAGTWASSGNVLCLAAGPMNADGYVDLVAGTRTGNNAGKVELWLNDGTGHMHKADEVPADSQVLSVAVGQLDLGNSSLDIAAGTKDRSVQVWFCDPYAAIPSGIIPTTESWADANAGGLVNAVAIGKVEASTDYPFVDPLNDVIVGTAINNTTGEIVIYLNPYVWTLQN